MRLALVATFGPIEPALRRDDHALGDVAKHRVGRAAEGAPCTRAGAALALLPDDLAAKEQLQPVLQDVDDVGAERSVGLAAEVGDVHRDAAAGLEHPHALGEDGLEHLEVLDVGGGHLVALDVALVVLADEVGRRRHDQRHRVVGEVVHVARVADDERCVEIDRTVDRVVVSELWRREARVEVGRVVALASPDTEARGGRVLRRRGALRSASALMPPLLRDGRWHLGRGPAAQHELARAAGVAGDVAVERVARELVDPRRVGVDGLEAGEAGHGLERARKSERAADVGSEHAVGVEVGVPVPPGAVRALVAGQRIVVEHDRRIEAEVEAELDVERARRGWRGREGRTRRRSRWRARRV